MNRKTVVSSVLIVLFVVSAFPTSTFSGGAGSHDISGASGSQFTIAQGKNANGSFPYQANKDAMATRYANILPGTSNAAASSGPYCELLGTTFTQNFNSMSYNVTAVLQSWCSAAYLLCGLSDKGYMYEVGLSYNWWDASGIYHGGFNAYYCVFYPDGSAVYPEILHPLSVTNNDYVNLTLKPAGGLVVDMSVYDWNTGAADSQLAPFLGATNFVGLNSAWNSVFSFTGLMTELLYTGGPYGGNIQEVDYSDVAFPKSSAWMWMQEIDSAGNFLSSDSTLNPVSFVSNPTLFQLFNSSGTTEYSNAYQFVTFGTSNQWGAYNFYISIVPASVTMTIGASQVFYSSVSPYGTYPYSYQWYLNGNPVYSGYTSWTFTPSSAGYYTIWAGVTDGAALGPMHAASNTSVIMVLPVVFPVTTQWIPSQDSYSSAYYNYGSPWSPGGNCYGLSSTEVLYFMHCKLGNINYPYFPAQSPSATSTSQLTLPPIDPTGMVYVLNNAGLAIMFHQVYAQAYGLGPPSQDGQFCNLAAALASGTPTVLCMQGTDRNGNIARHAIVAYGAIQNSGGTFTIQVSDPNYPGEPETATYNSIMKTFSYGPIHNDGLSFNQFVVATAGMIQTSWVPHSWLYYFRAYWKALVPNYYIVMADKLVTVNSFNQLDYFSAPKDSGTFVNGISGSSGIEEGNVQVYAIPSIVPGWPFTVHDPGSNESSIMLSLVDNESGQLVGKAYFLEATTTQGVLNFTVTPSSDGLSLSTGDNGLNVSVTLFCATQQSYSVFQTSNIAVDAMQTVNFTATNWQMLTSVVPSKTVVGQGFSTSINVTMTNPMDYTETFNVATIANATSIASQNITLPGGNSAAITFSWNTTGFDYGNYSISAVTDTALGETAANGHYTGGNIIVTIPGDINGNFKVSLADLVLLANAYGTTPATGGNPGVPHAWNPNADIDGNAIVGLSDLVIMAYYWGQNYP